jgi:hypothetical protein
MVSWCAGSDEEAKNSLFRQKAGAWRKRVNLITILWSMAAAVSLSLGVIHGMV